jgi:hypothetical protein
VEFPQKVGALLNQRDSISLSNPLYPEATAAGRAVLEKAGYKLQGAKDEKTEDWRCTQNSHH